MLQYESHNDISVTRFLERAKNQSPDSKAITFNDVSYTWQQLYDRSIQLACYLRNRGVKSGDRIAIISNNTNQYIELYFACSFLAAIIVPINNKLSDKEIESVLLDCEPLFVFRSVPESVYNSVWDVEPFTPGANDDPCAILYTSGSTGNPKGVIVSHKSYYINSVAAKSMFNLREKSNVLVSGPLHFSAVINRIFTSVFLQQHIVLMEKFEPEIFAQNIQYHNINVFSLAPTMLKMLFAMKDFYEYDYSSVENIQYAGEPMPKEFLNQLKAHFTTVEFYDSYGSTETQTMLSNGRLVSHMDARIVDGELQVRGPTITEGYWLFPNANMGAFDDGWYKTGDSAYKENDLYFITGRVNDMILSGGINIYPAEIENVLMKHPDIKDVAVIGVPDEKWGQVPKAFIVGQKNDYESFCRQYLAGFKAPKHYVYLEKLPLNGSNKVDKTALKTV